MPVVVDSDIINGKSVYCDMYYYAIYVYSKAYYVWPLYCKVYFEDITSNGKVQLEIFGKIIGLLI